MKKQKHDGERFLSVLESRVGPLGERVVTHTFSSWGRKMSRFWAERGAKRDWQGNKRGKKPTVDLRAKFLEKETLEEKVRREKTLSRRSGRRGTFGGLLLWSWNRKVPRDRCIV